MVPIKTHGAALPQQELTRSAGGCPSGPRPGDLMLEGREGANPLVGRRVANADILQPPGISSLMLGDVEHKNATRLEIYKLLVAAAKSYGPRTRPTDLDITDRIRVVVNFLYPKGVSGDVDLNNKTLKEKIIKFTHKCENLYSNCRRNMSWFCKKHHSWLASPFEIGLQIIGSDQQTGNTIENEVSVEQDDKMNQTHGICSNASSTEVGTSSSAQSTSFYDTIGTCSKAPTTSALHTIGSTSSTRPTSILHEISNFANTSTTSIHQEIGSFENAPSTSTHNENQSNRQKRRALKNLEQALEDQSPSKIIKIMMSKIVTDDGGAKLSKGSVNDIEFVVKECLKSPTRPKKIANLIRFKSEAKPLTPDEALSMIIDRKLTVDDYTSMQQNLKHRGFNAYPPYYKVQTAKKLCYPEEEIITTEKEASISLFSLLLHTFRRIVESNDKIITEYCEQHQKETIQCTLEGSWGFDGSTGQSLYKQNFTDGDDDEHCLFATTYIPLILKTQDGFVLWVNPNPQSFRYCRPLKIQYHPETKQLILNEKKRVDDEIQELSSLYAETVSGQSVIADPKLYLTIIDGKVFNAVTDTNSQLRCACCGATASEFNKLDVVRKKPVNSKTFLHGLSPLHAWIRIFEFLLHLGYKNDPAVRTWRVAKNSVAARIVEDRKKRIQSEIRSKLSLLVDVVRPNSGTSNDGNTARTALSDDNRKTFADILGIDQWLVDDLHTILVALSSGLPIDVDKFRDFTSQVAAKYVENYCWYYMTVTMHKILIHGWQIIETSPLPIGMLSEQAGESRNKFWRYDREHHTRKIDRKITILDLFRRALESSDPFISNLSLKDRVSKQKRLPIPAKVLSLLKPTTEPKTIEFEIKEDADIVLCTDEVLIHSDNE